MSPISLRYHSGLQASIQSYKIPKAEVALPFQIFGTIKLGEDIISCYEPFEEAM